METPKLLWLQGASTDNLFHAAQFFDLPRFSELAGDGIARPLGLYRELQMDLSCP